MNTKVTFLAVALGASSLIGMAKDEKAPREMDVSIIRQGRPGGAFHLLPPMAREALDITKEQQKKLDELEASSKSKLEKILTPEQAKKLKDRRPPGGRGEDERMEVEVIQRRGGSLRLEGGEGEGQRRVEITRREFGPGEAGRGGPGGPRGQGGPGGPGGPRGNMGEQRPMPPLLGALDRNGDGIFDADEIEHAARALKKLDKNGDGKVTPDEYRPQRPGGQGGQGGQGGPGGEGRGRPQPPNGDRRP